RALVLAGEPAPPALHAFAHAANHALGAPVRLIEPVDAGAGATGNSLAELVRDMRAGQVRTLVMLGVNPVYDAPADLAFATALTRVPHVFHGGLETDETAARAHAHAPLAHELETWGDARAFDGTVTIQQPTIEPLFGGRSALELLAALAGEPDAAPRELVRRTWRERGLGDEPRWRDALRSGVVPGTAAAPVRAVPSPPPLSVASAPAIGPGAAPPAIELHFRPDPSAWDGRHAANPWLQELPRPFTRVTWDNALLLSPGTAAGLGVGDGDRVRVTTAAGAQLAPVLVLAGVAPGVAVAPLGGGRTHAGPVGTGVGFDANRLRQDAAPWVAPAALARAGGTHAFARAQVELDDHGRGLARVVRAGAALAREPEHRPQLFPDRSATPDGIAWGMSIDLDLCTGCQACVVACQAENNIPPVGREQVARGRAMHWIRVDEDVRSASPMRVHQPVPCMHCENAPCELVCPVGATVHSPEGLNEMVYNRCIGTRYCSNNCPYKVRRFNFLRFAETDAPVLALLKNPDVSVRDRGVMEKCSYCVQRIQEARIGAQVAGRALKDGDVTPACAQACPAQAIVFGNLAEPGSRVARARADARGYAMLAELGTRPRTTYLARTWNPSPALGAGAPST
ncbi:MAG TPA: 4Fe-4S dicluster domain-containing protein, partial [Candidatus Eisenbacteria bacterium]|nr:4Fe-4S dicluster domain-containing protein [Candidatus Eisenbacteria bacterium]